MAKWHIEVTDTFGGEANYSWLSRYNIKDIGQTDLQLVRQVKKLIGWNGLRCTVEHYGDDLTLRPSGMCQVCFVTFQG